MSRYAKRKDCPACEGWGFKTLFPNTPKQFSYPCETCDGTGQQLPKMEIVDRYDDGSVIMVSGDSGRSYGVGLFTCDCRDHFINKHNCKHMRHLHREINREELKKPATPENTCPECGARLKREYDPINCITWLVCRNARTTIECPYQKKEEPNLE